MARYDKYNPYGGGFRAPLAVAWDAADAGKPYGVGINGQGAIVKGAGTSGIVGVLILTKAYPAGTVVDVMKFGEITEFAPTATAPGTGSGAAGTEYYAAAATGVISSATAAGSQYVGHTVEASRLIAAVDATLLTS